MLIRTGILNITVDTDTQRRAYLHANFGVDTNDEEPVNLDEADDIQIENVLEQAKREAQTFTPPIPSLRCTYWHIKRPGTRGALRIR